MTDPAYSAAELARLDACAMEPIRTPGAIQPHGVLIGVEPDSLLVTLVSENAADALGRPVADVLGPLVAEAVGRGGAVDPIPVEFGGHGWDALVQTSDGRVLVELEPALASLQYARTAAVGTLQRLAGIRSAQELQTAVAHEIRTMTGFDRVLVYTFHEDQHGEVVADDHVRGMESYLGLHFPASDIPPQARDLYRSKVSRAIVSTSAEPVQLISLDADAGSVDLSAAELRSVSPYHLQYMRNMGQASTVSLSLLQGGELVGMITCAHRTERRLPIMLRRALEVIANQVSMQLESIAEIERLRREVAARARRSSLLSQLYGTDDVTGALLDGPLTILDVIEADGVLVQLGNERRTLGTTPSPDAVDRVLTLLEGQPIVSSALSRTHEAVSSLIPEVSGVLVVPLGTDGDTLMFFRNEVSTVIDWLGDQGEGNRPDPLSPRLSFSSWKESVSGLALPWGRLVVEATELGADLEVALRRRQDAELAVLAMRDPLTGLHNRRYLVDRLQNAIDDPARELGLSVLFIDLDDFKSVNDTFGHEVGDAVIVEVGRRLTSGSRAHDLVARLGGDEFVVVCDDITPEDAKTMAQRLVDAIAKPIQTRTVQVRVSASCGVVSATEDSDGTSLLRAADSAMYRAKSGGRNRVSS